MPPHLSCILTFNAMKIYPWSWEFCNTTIKCRQSQWPADYFWIIPINSSDLYSVWCLPVFVTEKENDMPKSSQIHPVPLSPTPVDSLLFACQIQRIGLSPFQSLTALCNLLKYLIKCWTCNLPPKIPVLLSFCKWMWVWTGSTSSEIPVWSPWQ